ncbi:hypothetical protein BUALT_Bualt02G0035300 [Buddleja alternifolia]|uniref:Retrotransposon gag domain-containing protein n=1 Tax=Buddleja alternifolia TaxID=168488 RepID=A0AAV6Y5M6_9LAMI|nr:hypothetical protein BUALT_Bualt02G0035300 [Buddleja alternifolia]
MSTTEGTPRIEKSNANPLLGTTSGASPLAPVSLSISRSTGNGSQTIDLQAGGDSRFPPPPTPGFSPSKNGGLPHERGALGAPHFNLLNMLPVGNAPSVVDQWGRLVTPYATPPFINAGHLTTYTTGSFPTTFPSGIPTNFLSVIPTTFPSGVPAAFPLTLPITFPSGVLAAFPSAIPTTFPSGVPTAFPSVIPTTFPSGVPAAFSSAIPTTFPSGVPATFSSTIPIAFPSTIPGTAFPPHATSFALPLTTARTHEDDRGSLVIYQGGGHHVIVGANVFRTTTGIPRQGHLERETTGLPRTNVIEKIKDMQEEMRRIRQHMGVGAPDSPRGVPFGLRILVDDLPNNFHARNVSEYDGSSDPTEHLWKFENSALLHQYSDGVKCRVFLTTLTWGPQQWFNQLAPNSTHSFKELSSLFLHQFASSKKYQKTPLSLFIMHQGVKEPLRGYIQRFNDVALEVPSASAEVLSNAFAQGLNDGEFFRSFAKNPPISLNNLLTRAEKYHPTIYIQIKENCN